MTQHNTVTGDGPAGPDDDYGPPDWFAAVAEPEPDPGGEPEPERASRRAPSRRAGRAPGQAARGPETGPGPMDAVGGGLGLVSASDLPTGRRRRRSALEEEAAPGRRAGGEAAGHGGAAASSSDTGPRARRARTRAERDERDGRDERTGLDDRDGRDDAPEPGAARRTKPAKRSGQPGRSGAEETADPEARARDICLRLLTGAAKTRKQLADALRKREIPDEVADGVLTRLEEVGLIDDAVFAQAWVESRHAVRGLSRRALAQELRTKGVAGDLVEQAVAQLDQDDEEDAARALVERRLRVTRGLERQARMRRLVGMLARRGYSEGLAYRVVREVLDEEESGEGCMDGPSGEEWE
ncbi:recombination regulator RecX [Kitasatospora sp. NPDC092286]|uniref:recombination regulator RecX n=1 Tax=Kitasatospora sp. NPDC092286 TaxID=3364087 RepID=UPI0037FDA1B2